MCNTVKSHLTAKNQAIPCLLPGGYSCTHCRQVPRPDLPQSATDKYPLIFMIIITLQLTLIHSQVNEVPVQY